MKKFLLFLCVLWTFGYTQNDDMKKFQQFLEKQDFDQGFNFINQTNLKPNRCENPNPLSLETCLTLVPVLKMICPLTTNAERRTCFSLMENLFAQTIKLKNQTSAHHYALLGTSAELASMYLNQDEIEKAQQWRSKNSEAHKMFTLDEKKEILVKHGMDLDVEYTLLHKLYKSAYDCTQQKYASALMELDNINKIAPIPDMIKTTTLLSIDIHARQNQWDAMKLKLNDFEAMINQSFEPTQFVTLKSYLALFWLGKQNAKKALEEITLAQSYENNIMKSAQLFYYGTLSQVHAALHQNTEACSNHKKMNALQKTLGIPIPYLHRNMQIQCK